MLVGDTHWQIQSSLSYEALWGHTEQWPNLANAFDCAVCPTFSPPPEVGCSGSLWACRGTALVGVSCRCAGQGTDTAAVWTLAGGRRTRRDSPRWDSTGRGFWPVEVRDRRVMPEEYRWGKGARSPPPRRYRCTGVCSPRWSFLRSDTCGRCIHKSGLPVWLKRQKQTGAGLNWSELMIKLIKHLHLVQVLVIRVFLSCCPS